MYCILPPPPTVPLGLRLKPPYLKPLPRPLRHARRHDEHRIQRLHTIHLVEHLALLNNPFWCPLVARHQLAGVLGFRGHIIGGEILDGVEVPFCLCATETREDVAGVIAVRVTTWDVSGLCK